MGNTQEERLSKFRDRVSAILGYVAEIHAVVYEHHLGADLENITWVDVVEAGVLRDELKRIADRLMKRGEYAETEE